MIKKSYIYLLTNKYNKVLYTGVTSNIINRIHQHKQKFVKSFTNKYNADKLVYYEIFENILDAIEREKQIKSWSRKKKNALIDRLNPEWIDLYSEISD